MTDDLESELLGMCDVMVRGKLGISDLFPQFQLQQDPGEQIDDGKHDAGPKSKFVKFHSYQLAKHSRYFLKLLQQPNEEHSKGSKTTRTVVLNDVAQESVHQIHEFVYKGKVEGMDFTMAQDLLVVAGRLEMKELTRHTSDVLLSGMSVHNANAIGLYKFGKSYGAQSLAQQAYSFILSNIWQIALFEKSSAIDCIEFAQLSEPELEALLRHDKLNLPRESAMLDIVAKWAKDVQTAVLAQLNCATAIGAGTFRLETMLFRPRIPNDVVFCIGGWSSGSPTSQIEVFDPKVNQWFPCPYTDHTPQAYHGMSVLDGYLYVVAGYDAIDYFSSVISTIIQVNQWFHCPYTDNTPRAYHGMSVLDGYLYVVAGYDAIDYFSSVRRFDPRTCVWSDVSALNTRRCYANTVVMDGYIYVIGGYDGARRHNTVERYDPAANQWSFVQPMNRVRSDTAAGALDGQIYVAGGFDGQTVSMTMECYSPETDQWRFLNEMSTPRSGNSMAVHNKHLYIIGGFDGNERLASMERYDPATNRARARLRPMHAARSNFSAAVMHDFIYVAGGYNGQGTFANVERYDIASDTWQCIQSMLSDRSALKLCVFHDVPNPERFTFYGTVQEQHSLENREDGEEGSRTGRPVGQ